MDATLTRFFSEFSGFEKLHLKSLLYTRTLREILNVFFCFKYLKLRAACSGEAKRVSRDANFHLQ